MPLECDPWGSELSLVGLRLLPCLNLSLLTCEMGTVLRPREESGRKALGKARIWCARGCRARSRPPCPGPHPHGARDWFSSRRCLRHRSFLRRTVAGRGGQRLLLRLPTHSPGLPERAPSPLLARHRLRPHGAFLNFYLLGRWNQPDSGPSRREEPKGGALGAGGEKRDTSQLHPAPRLRSASPRCQLRPVPRQAHGH